MTSDIITILLIEDNPGDARLLEEMLKEDREYNYTIEQFRTLSEGLARLRRGGVDIVLLDLGLPDSLGLETFEQTCKVAPDIPIIVFTGFNDEIIGDRAVTVGACDYLIKGQVDGESLTQKIRQAIGR